MTAIERTTEPENDICNSCTFECVAGWVEEYDSSVCPNCDGLIVSKAARKISDATRRLQVGAA